MKAVVFVLSLFILPAACFSQDYSELKSTGETMANTFNFEGDTLAGATCFMITKDGKEYFVTAAHLFKTSHPSGDPVRIRMLVQNQVQSYNAKVYFHPNRHVDIALLKLTYKISQQIEAFGNVLQSNGISLDSTFIAFGMPVLFYGFPLMNLGTEAFGIKFPLVKKGIFSGMIQYDNADVIVLDGHNNHGFSGGPVMAYNPTLKKMCIVGVISGNFRENRDIEFKGEKLLFEENSGIILCYGRQYIEDIFSANRKQLS